MSDEVETVAKAMRKVDGPRTPVWDDMTCAVQNQYRAMARVAIAAVRKIDARFAASEHEPDQR
jgi:hypothetical protein